MPDVPAPLPEGLIEDLAAVVGPESVLHEPRRMLAYEADGNPLFRSPPQAVVVPHTAQEVRDVVAVLARYAVPFLPRGAGTGLSGGVVAVRGGVVIDLARLRQVEEVDLPNERVRVQTGVTNARVTAAVADRGYLYAPDPSSQVACTVGGNIAENSGGSHCLKYGVTTNHVLAADVILPDGQAVRLGGEAPDLPGYDLLGAFVGSEGTMGIATSATLRVIRQTEALRTVLALFDDVPAASRAVSDVIAAGIVPAAMEMMDNLAMQGVELGPYPVGFPKDVGAVLLIEVDGLEVAVKENAERIEAICGRQGVRSVRVAQSPEERALWWANRKTAFGAMGNLAHSYYVQDGVIPRSRLPQVLERIAAVGDTYRVRIANVFHAGDGNLHPLILFDDTVPGERERAVRAGSDILAVCVEEGGSITGEHGVGLEKQAEMALMFTPEELALQDMVRGVFDPAGIANPGKVLPLTPKASAPEQDAAVSGR